MKRQTKIWLILAASFLAVGCIMFGCVMSALQWDFRQLSTTQFETNVYSVTEPYTNVSIVGDTADIVFLPSDDNTTKVVCYEEQGLRHTVSVQDDRLVVQFVNTEKWYEHIGINFESPKITVYMPKGAYGALTIKTDTGDVTIPKAFTFESMDIQGSTGDVTNEASVSHNIKVWVSTGAIRMEKVTAEALDLAVSTGKVTTTDVTCTGDVAVSVSTGKTVLTNVSCASFLSSGNTGDISLYNVIAANKLSIARTTGDVTFERCDAAELVVTTDTGDVRGSLLTDKVFMAHSDTGRVTVPETTSGGRCKITTDTGSIDIHLTE